MNLATKERWRKRIVGFFRMVLLIGIAYVILLPLIHRLSTAFMGVEDLYDQSVRWIPRNPTFRNFRLMWEHMDYVRSFANSFFLATLTSVLQLLTCSMVGYGLARLEFPGSKVIFGLAVFTLVIPPQLIMVPSYLNFRFFDLLGILKNNPINLTGSYWPFVLLAITGTGFRCGLYIFIMRQFFKGMPRALEEAAYIDGAGLFTTFWRVMIPGAIPGLITTFLFSFVWQWNDYLYVTTFNSGGKFLPQSLEAAATKVAAAVNETDALASTSGFLDDHFYSLINNAGMVLVIVPLLILYILLQRYFVESVERTGIVG
ncbi:MAG: carbohydrate ABC transporter permease [Bacillota bacterium]|nr:carbohydrate ABC transporter permease [Bacillota bacterium]HHU62582.1 carbohydrate ABC transporter permease [Natronincola sp.]